MASNMKHFTASAPGKVILFGEHSVVYDKTAVAVSVDLRTTLSVTRTSNSTICLYVPDMSKAHRTWDLIELSSLGLSRSDAKTPRELSQEDLSRLQHFVGKHDIETMEERQAAIALLFLYCYISAACGPDSGFEMAATSTLPIGAGMGSSASFSVCLSTAILNLAGVFQLSNKSVLQKEDLDLINRWAYMAEKIFHGSPSGIDNSICTYGGGLVFKSGTFHSFGILKGMRIMMVNTNVMRSTKTIVADVRQMYDKHPGILEDIFNAIDKISICSVAVLTNIAQNGATKENCGTLEELIQLNHGLLRSLGVSHKKLEAIISTAAEFSLSGKMTGAGAGGYAYILLSEGTQPLTICDLERQLSIQGLDCREVYIGGHGVTLCTSD